MGHLHKHAQVTKERYYWDADGLLGKKATLGALENIKRDYPKEFKILKPYRDLAYKELKKYQRKFPKKMSLIHADLHFGNMLFSKNEIFPIDFDDCGYGFHMYDLAVVLYSSYTLFKKVGKVKAFEYRQALFDGYGTEQDLTIEDLNFLPYCLLTRDIAMIGWLYDRRDNPRLLKYLSLIHI